ncbi:MAG TPA: heme-copper oxidase subunit III [Terracidiphilus sp.]|nr:heme-copper oxidase subunit III [Terracidiphilus sp.]
MTTASILVSEGPHPPSRGMVAMSCLIIGESAIFTLFIVAYVFFMGRNVSGPTPAILSPPWVNTVCLLASSFTVLFAERAIDRGQMKRFAVLWAITILLALKFLAGTATEWRDLIYNHGLTISVNVFGTTYYSLVGLHATHVILGLIMLSVVLGFTLTGHVNETHAERIKVLALYWHFVDWVWVAVFTTVYLIGR